MEGINSELKISGVTVLKLCLLYFFSLCCLKKMFLILGGSEKVSPIFKKSNRSLTKNYRGISILDTSYKKYAKIITKVFKLLQRHFYWQNKDSVRYAPV